MTISSLIIDDEQLARDMLEAYAIQIPFIEVMGKCSNANEAQAYLDRYDIDLLFLDIHMPIRSGIDFIQQQSQPPMVIFTTAYTDYAIDSFALNALDYLLKPIGFDRFEAATKKAKNKLEMVEKAQAFEAQQRFSNQTLLVKEGYNYHKIAVTDIRYIEAMREYVVYHTSQGKIMELKAISQLENKLSSTHFLRIHRSFIVAKSFVKGRNGNKLLLKDNTSLPMGKTYKKQVVSHLF